MSEPTQSSNCTGPDESTGNAFGAEAADFKLEGLDLGKYREQLRPYVERVSSKYQAKFDESDIIQETLADAQRHLSDFRGKSETELTNWLRRMLNRNLIDAVRRLRSHKRDVAREMQINRPRPSSDGSTAIQLLSELTSPSGQVVWNEQLQQMRMAIEALPDGQREAVTLHHLQGMTLAEVAKVMNRSTAAVAGLLHRALCFLNSNLRE